MKPWRRAALSFGLPAVGLCAVALASGPAHACGGTFCSNGSVPVRQSAETVIFHVEGGEVQAHIQVSVDETADTDTFAWLIPVPAIPTFEVGSEALFDLVQPGPPAYRFTQRRETGCTCRLPSGGDDGWDGTGGCSVGGCLDVAGGGDGGGNPPPAVMQHSVGAFEAAVLQGGTVTSVYQWLEANDYYADPAAAPILKNYLDEGHLFVALRLRNDEGVGDIHPVVIRYGGETPCLPLRLTRIAAEQDMPVRVIGFGQHRLAPLNWHHVEINPLALDWSNLQTSWADVVIRAIDEAPGGLGWITERAVSVPGSWSSALVDPRWDPSAFVSADAEQVIELLEQQGLVDCDQFEAFERHPLILGLLQKHLPYVEMPGFEPRDYYCPDREMQLMGEVDASNWDGGAFAADFAERIVDPALRADEMLDETAFVTSLLTFISPHEMVEDPMFLENPDLPRVEPSAQANSVVGCDGYPTVSIEGWPDFHLPPFSSSWPSSTMPPALRLERVAPVGSPIVESDFRPQVLAALDAWEQSVGWPGPIDRPACDGDGSYDPDGPLDLDPAAEEGPGSGDAGATCACNEASRDGVPAGLGWVVLMAGSGLALRRRR